MRRIHVHSHGPRRPCPVSLRQIVAAVHSGERVCVVATTQEEADAYADQLAADGLLDVERGGAYLEISPCPIH